MHKKLSIIVITLLYFSNLPSVFAQGMRSIGISPITVYIAGKPGSTASQDMVIFNKGDAAFLFVCSLEDYWYENNKTKSAPLGTFKEKQAGAWLQCSPNRKIIPAGGQEKIRVLAAIPQNATGDSFALFNAHMRPVSELNSEAKQTIQASGRIGARTTVRALGTEKTDAQILEAKITQEKKFQVFSAKVKNIGNTHLSGKGNLVISDSSANVLGKVEIVLPFTFPTMTKEISANLIQNLPTGTYQALLSLSGEGNTSLVKEFSVTIQ